MTTTPIKSIVGDVRKLTELRTAMKDVSTVIHTAGLVSFGTFPDTESMEQVNVKGRPTCCRPNTLFFSLRKLIQCYFILSTRNVVCVDIAQFSLTTAELLLLYFRPNSFKK